MLNQMLFFYQLKECKLHDHHKYQFSRLKHIQHSFLQLIKTHLQVFYPHLGATNSFTTVSTIAEPVSSIAEIVEQKLNSKIILNIGINNFVFFIRYGPLYIF